MTLEEHLKGLEPTEEIGLCYEGDWHTEFGTSTRVYDTFFLGNVQEVPKEVLKCKVVNSFEAFMWHYTCYILERKGRKKRK